MVDETDSGTLADEIIRAELHGHEKYSDERWLGHQREHDLLNRATDVAATTLDKRVEALNEFRAQLSEQSKSFTTRDLHDKLDQDFNRRLGTVIDRVILLEKGNVKEEGKNIGQAATIATIIAAISLGGVVLSILINVLTAVK